VRIFKIASTVTNIGDEILNVVENRSY
jgi:hypothetical protein